MRMLKTLNMALIGCPVGFSKEIIAVFPMKKFQIDTENDKNPKFSNFQRFYAFFPTFLKEFVDWNNEKGQREKNLLTSRFFRRVYCSFLHENVSN